jgi:hypothetical protein
MPELSSAQMLEQLVVMVSTPRCTEDVKRRAVDLAYQIGKCEGRLEGALSMGEQMTASLERLKPA